MPSSFNLALKDLIGVIWKVHIEPAFNQGKISSETSLLLKLYHELSKVPNLEIFGGASLYFLNSDGTEHPTSLSRKEVPLAICFGSKIIGILNAHYAPFGQTDLTQKTAFLQHLHALAPQNLAFLIDPKTGFFRKDNAYHLSTETFYISCFIGPEEFNSDLFVQGLPADFNDHFLLYTKKAGVQNLN